MKSYLCINVANKVLAFLTNMEPLKNSKDAKKSNSGRTKTENAGLGGSVGCASDW